MAAAQCCTEAIRILWDILKGVAQGEMEKETVKLWMDRSRTNLQEVTALTERRRVSVGMSKAAESHLMLMRDNLTLCMDLQTHINAAGPLQHQQGPQVEHEEQEPLQQEQHQTEQQLQQQQQQQQEDNIIRNMAIKFENSFEVTSSLPKTPEKILIEIDAATPTTSTSTVSPTKNKRELSTNGITTSNKSTVTLPVKRQKVDSTTEDDFNNNETTEDDSNNNQSDRSIIEETNGSPSSKIFYNLLLIKPYELEDKHMYQITMLREVKSPSGPTVIAHLDNKYQLFLPKHLSQSLLDNRDLFENAKRSIVKKEKYFVNAKGSCFFLNKSM